MSQPTPERPVILPARRRPDASQLIRANRKPEQAVPAPEQAPLAANEAPSAAPPAAPSPIPADTASAPAKTAPRSVPPATVGKGQISVLIDADVRDRAKAALRLAAFYEDTDSFAQLVESALTREINRLQDTYNDGQPIEPRAKKLTPGRRARS